MSSSPTRGAFIVIEGLDRAGKTTQVQRLANRLRGELGLIVESIKFPDRATPIGQNLNSYLTQPGASLPLEAAHLLFSANRWEAADSLRQKLNSGTTLVVDRYSYSGAVYTTAKASLSAEPSEGRANKDSDANGPARQRSLPLDWTWACEIGLPAPDMLVFLDIETTVAAERGGFGEERYETSEMQRAVRKTFYKLIERTDTPVMKINAGREIEVVEEDIWEAVKGVVEKRRDRPEVKRLGPLKAV